MRNSKNDLRPASFNWKVIRINWDAMSDDVTELKAGTPMDKDGNVANDANCYGILMEDTRRRKKGEGRVIVAGRVDLKEAEENSGIVLSEEAKAALVDVEFPGAGGVSSWNDLTDKPFGTFVGEKEVFVEEVTLDNFSRGAGDSLSMFSGTGARIPVGAIKNDEIIKNDGYSLANMGPYTVVFDGELYEGECVSNWAEGVTYYTLGNEGLLWSNPYIDGELPFVIRVFSTDGAPFALFVADPDTPHTIEIYQQDVEITRLDEKYMPTLTSPNGTKYKITVADDGTLSATAV